MNQSSQEISILRFFHNILKEKRVLIITPLLFLFVGIFVSLYLPKEYDSIATWIPNSQSNDNGLSGLASLAGINLGSSSNDENQLLPSLLQSDSILFNLQGTKLGHSEYPNGITLTSYLKLDEQIQELEPLAIPPFLREKIQAFIEKKIELNVSNLVSLTVVTQDPLFSKELNEFLVRQIISINSRIKTLKISRNRKFLEEQYSSYSDSLMRTENELLRFSENNTTSNSPRLTLEKSRLYRKTEIFGTISLEMRKQLELARLEERKQTDQIIFISKPTYALKPIAPKKKIIVLVSLVFGCLIGFIIAIFKLWWRESGKEELEMISKNINI